MYNIIMINPVEQIKEIIQNNINSNVSPLDALNPNTEWASDELQEQRYAICKTCPEFIKLTTQCKKCGCFMKIKSKMQKAGCPMEKL